MALRRSKSHQGLIRLERSIVAPKRQIEQEHMLLTSQPLSIHSFSSHATGITALTRPVITRREKNHSITDMDVAGKYASIALEVS